MNPTTLPHPWGAEPLNARQQAVWRSEAIVPAGSAAWALQRRCALSPWQLARGLGCVVVLPSVLALFFWTLGAPLISGLLLLQLIVVALAFAQHALHAADGELLCVRGDQLLVDRRWGLAQRREVFDLRRLRVVQGGQGVIELRACGRCLEVGAHAAPTQRQQVLRALQPALGEARART